MNSSKDGLVLVSEVRKEVKEEEIGATPTLRHGTDGNVARTKASRPPRQGKIRIVFQCVYQRLDAASIKGAVKWLLRGYGLHRYILSPSTNKALAE